MNKDRKKNTIMDCLLPICSALYCLGMLTLFRPCGPKDDGSWMHCHQAGLAVALCAALLVVLGIAHFLAGQQRVKKMLSVCGIVLAAVSAWIPGHVISLCMMDTMRCRMIMQPAALAGGVLMALLFLADLMMQ